MASQRGLISLRLLLVCLSVSMAGCGDVNETHIVTSVSGEGSHATVSSAGAVEVAVARDISRLELSLGDIRGDLTLRQGPREDAIIGIMASPSTEVTTTQRDGSLSLTLHGTVGTIPDGHSTLELPGHVPLVIHIDRSSGTLTLDLARRPLESVVVNDHEGALKLVMPVRGKAVITGGTGPVNVEVPAGSSVEVKAPETQVEVPVGYTEVSPGLWQSSADTMGPTIALQVEQHQGTAKIITK